MRPVETNIQFIRFIIIIIIFKPTSTKPQAGKLGYYYYYAAFNAPCVDHKDDESQARGSRGSTGSS